MPKASNNACVCCLTESGEIASSAAMRRLLYLFKSRRSTSR